jgi:hypothetical protein
MFTCKECGERKVPDSFYRHKMMATGYLSFCKDCVKERVRRHRVANLDRIQAYDRLRYKEPGPAARAAAAAHAWCHNHPDKRRTHYAVNNAVRDGRLIKPSCCEDCGGGERRIEGHHDDYGQPLSVRWLCKPCHGSAHRALNEAMRAAVHPMRIAAE